MNEPDEEFAKYKAKEAAMVAALVEDLETVLSMRPAYAIDPSGFPYLCILDAAFEFFLRSMEDRSKHMCGYIAACAASVHADAVRKWADQVLRALEGPSDH